MRDEIERAARWGRHERRVEETIKAARRSNGETRGLLLLILDVDGVGGRCDTGVEGRSWRLTPFRDLGSGRWQAGDAGAYMAAAEEAIRRIHDNDNWGDDSVWPPIITLMRDGGIHMQLLPSGGGAYLRRYDLVEQAWYINGPTLDEEDYALVVGAIKARAAYEQAGGERPWFGIYRVEEGVEMADVERAARWGRHQKRVEDTIKAAARHNGELPGLLLLILDQDGVGGRCGTGVEGRSLRLTPFRNLGSGRWRARDGGAYKAAADEAISRLHYDNLPERDGIWPPIITLHPDGGISMQLSASWRVAMSRRELVVSARHTDEPTLDERDYELVVQAISARAAYEQAGGERPWFGVYRVEEGAVLDKILDLEKGGRP